MRHFGSLTLLRHSRLADDAMSLPLRKSNRRHARALRSLLALALAATCGSLAAQQPAAHYQFAASQQPPGAVGAQRLQAGGPVQGYFQPVELTAPEGVLIGLAAQGGWTEPVDGSFHAGMLIGVPYRVQLQNLPEEFNSRECYPTIEIIDRTYAPQGMAQRFPIPVVFNEDDLRLATKGMLVTRVIYVEDPQLAIPGVQAPGDQLWHDAGSKANPLEVADRLGRPVAIVRLGARMPDQRQGPDLQFTYGCPPWQRLSAPADAQWAPAPNAAPLKSARASNAAAR